MDEKFLCPRCDHTEFVFGIDMEDEQAYKRCTNCRCCVYEDGFSWLVGEEVPIFKHEGYYEKK